jgi:hypothetical protein
MIPSRSCKKSIQSNFNDKFLFVCGKHSNGCLELGQWIKVLI